VLITATSSHIWLVLGMWFPFFWGDYHTRVRFAIIDINFVVMLGCSIAAFRSKDKGKVLLIIACLLTTVLWSFEGAINATV
jgi:peptidoglycan/LPS O-acetylase OafA/YrhL